MPGTRPARYRRGGSATPAPSDLYDIGQARVLGFFLDLTTKLSGETMFAAEAAKLHARSPAKPTQFFRPTTWR